MIPIHLHDILIPCVFFVQVLRMLRVDEVVLDTGAEHGRDEAFLDVVYGGKFFDVEVGSTLNRFLDSPDGCT